jgi:putative endonuclease
MVLPAFAFLAWGMAPTRSFVPVSDWENQRQLLGLEGERLAIAFLTSCGWGIESHRFRLGRHEIDLIIRKASLVAFVEVKTRRSLAFGSAREAVHQRKQRDIARVASLWVERHGRAGDEYRFDVVVVEGVEGITPAIEHIPDAWRAAGLWV